MTVPNSLLTLLDGAIWVICILLGMGAGSFLGRLVGRLLGWMVANSLDQNIRKGGLLGRKWGTLAGVGTGVALGIYGALHFTTLIAHTTGH